MHWLNVIVVIVNVIVRISGFAKSTSTRVVALYIHKTIYKRFSVTYDLRKDIAITILLLLFTVFALGDLFMLFKRFK